MKHAANHAEEERKIARDNATTLPPLMEDETVQAHHQSQDHATLMSAQVHFSYCI